VSDPNDSPCDICGHILGPEDCFCSECGVRLCTGCAFENSCEEWQGERVVKGGDKPHGSTKMQNL